MLKRLRELDGKTRRGTNQLADALIAETAMRHKASVVSGDASLRKMCAEFGVGAMSLEEFASGPVPEDIAARRLP